MADIYEELKARARDLFKGNGILDKPVRVTARALTPEEAIGNPEGDDFPIQKGKEKLMQADFEGSLGQAFTDQYGDFEGTLAEVLEMPLENNYRRAVFVATLNAVLRYLDRADKTIHCRDEEPVQCAMKLVEYIEEKYGSGKILQIGFQPRMVEFLAQNFPLRVVDLDPDNIGVKKFSVVIEGPESTQDAIEWAELLLVTGTTNVNGTIEMFLGHNKPVIFYGTTIAGAAALMNWDRFCAMGK